MELAIAELAQYWEQVKAFFAFDTALLGDPGMVARLTLQVLLLGGSAFFSGSETALFSLSRLDLQKLRRERNRHSETLHALLDQPRRLIISILCGNELVNIAAAANMTGILVGLYGPERAGWVTLIVMVPLLLLFGEVTPKTISVSNPVRISTRIVAAPMSVWVKLIAPLVWAIRGIADKLTSMIVGEEPAAENILQLDEFRSLVEEVSREGELNATERALIYNLLEAGDTEVVEIMTPRTRTEFLSAEMGPTEIVELFRSYRHPRVPVFRVHRDNIVGFIHAEDILRLILDKTDLSGLRLEDIMHPPVVVPLTKKVDEMFDFFQLRNARAAAVLNEFGGVEGFVTMKDVLTFIFGQISGDVTGQELYHERDDNTYEVKGDMKLTDFNNLTNFGIEDPRMTTIGGVAFRHLDRLPKVGDTISVEDITISVLEMDAHRIARVRVARGGAGEAAAGDGPPEDAATEETMENQGAGTSVSEGDAEAPSGEQTDAASVAETIPESSDEDEVNGETFDPAAEVSPDEDEIEDTEVGRALTGRIH
ncbi:MAG: hemolysin family protein [Gammaproteobacteria bacterium]|jgi:CBS domain containing-hemolysin-like protein|nr:hemolysin family protein [Gammaproteobacteria bacterium]